MGGLFVYFLYLFRPQHYRRACSRSTGQATLSPHCHSSLLIFSNGHNKACILNHPCGLDLGALSLLSIKQPLTMEFWTSSTLLKHKYNRQERSKPQITYVFLTSPAVYLRNRKNHFSPKKYVNYRLEGFHLNF